ncbi:endonuclease/exonuclease/phosphatase family protein [Candidatus Nitrotoga sp. M5]|uniref:endonuclease/exonuclease/phosphatase family protein n=1 Tax=Candidatus Nitrotoga sp. M5 TaxID=2890409 RepID=UPI00403DC58D
MIPTIDHTIADRNSLMPMPRPSFRVLTVNMHKGFGFLNRRFILPELRSAVRAVQADVVFLQEVQGDHTEHAMRQADWPPVPQYEFLADEMWPEFAYGRNAVYPQGHHGNALLSKYPIVQNQNWDMSIEGTERRGLLHCTLAVPGFGDVHAVCVHLGLLEDHRRQQLDILCAMVNDEIPPQAPLVVAGDFNDWRSRANDHLTHDAGLQEVFEMVYGRSARTFPARFPVFRLDRIYVRGAGAHAPMVLPRRPWSHLSDHAPLAADIDL